MNDLKKGYFDWLCRLVCPSGGRPGGTRTFLLQRLHQKEFYSLIGNDDNRIEDGKGLRMTYCREIGKPGAIGALETNSCSVLEMMIALARRISQEIMFGLVENNSVDRWFWEMAENLGVADCTDDVWWESDRYYVVDDAVETLLTREYDVRGKGGLFPLKHPQKDQRGVEIWYQANAYLMENY